MQPQMAALVRKLVVAAIAQYSDGDIVLQSSPREAAQRYPGMCQEPQSIRIAGGADALIAASVRQLAKLFGAEAARPVASLFKDWAADPSTAMAADQIATRHPVPDLRPWVSGDWQRRILLVGSETSPSEPGYLTGAVEAAHRAPFAATSTDDYARPKSLDWDGPVTEVS